MTGSSRASGGWLRFVVALVIGAAALCSLGLASRAFVHSQEPWSQVGCLDSSCSYGMPMTSPMSGTGAMTRDDDPMRHEPGR
jgi:hypothetical protein